MPFGNCFLVRFATFSAICGCIMLAVRFFTSWSMLMPSIMLSGSMTLPLDFDIFLPSSSRMRPVT